LEGLRYLLPEEEAKDKAAGESWPSKLMSLAERQLGALDDNESR
jgi:dynein heavy chain